MRYGSDGAGNCVFVERSFICKNIKAVVYVKQLSRDIFFTVNQLSCYSKLSTECTKTVKTAQILRIFLFEPLLKRTKQNGWRSIRKLRVLYIRAISECRFVHQVMWYYSVGTIQYYFIDIRWYMIHITHQFTFHFTSRVWRANEALPRNTCLCVSRSTCPVRYIFFQLFRTVFLLLFRIKRFCRCSSVEHTAPNFYTHATWH